MTFLCRIRQQWGTHKKAPRDSQSNPEQKGHCWRCHNSRLQNILWNHSHKTIVALTTLQQRHTDQKNGLKVPEINPCGCNHLQLNEGTRSTHWRKHSLFSKLCWENLMSTGQRMRLDLCVLLFTKKFTERGSETSPWDLRLTSARGDMGESCQDAGTGKVSLSRIQELRKTSASSYEVSAWQRSQYMEETPPALGGIMPALHLTAN